MYEGERTTRLIDLIIAVFQTKPGGIKKACQLLGQILKTEDVILYVCDRQKEN